MGSPKGGDARVPAGHPALSGTPWEAFGHPVLIPGSNRDMSYILRPLEGAVRSAYSVNHGAGRRMSRGEALRQLDPQKVNEQYRREGIVVNTDGDVPLDELSQCYKRSEEVMQAVVDAGLARIEHHLWPLASIKGNEEGMGRQAQREKEDRKGAAQGEGRGAAEKDAPPRRRLRRLVPPARSSARR